MADASEAVENQLGQFIPLHYHCNMLLDNARMSSFQEAIDFLTPDDGLVLELGGGTGVLSHFAARRAAHVWCVERNPELVAAARRFLDLNETGRRVDVIQADACDFVPPEPVDLVICEMLHVGLVREQQVAVLDRFKRNYVKRFGPVLPKFVPEASLLALQPVEQVFDFHGYQAPIPIFQAPGIERTDTVALANPFIYACVEYDRTLPQTFTCQASFTCERPGRVNAVRLVTQNVLAIQEQQGRAVEWANQYLIAPLRESFDVRPGDTATVSLQYEAGCELPAMMEQLDVQRTPAPRTNVPPQRRAA